MIVSAAVKILDLKEHRAIIIPCHRHCDAYRTLKQFGYKKNVDYKELAQGFLDENNNFHERESTHKHAWLHGQLSNKPDLDTKGLYSEDLY